MLKLMIAMPCPYCVRVTDWMADNNVLNVDVVDTKWDASVHDDLRRRYGKSQVPLLLIDGEPLFESEDIIQYLKHHQEGTSHEPM